MTSNVKREDEATAPDLSAPLDALLVSAATASLYRFLPGAETTAFGASLARKPKAVTAQTLDLVAELARVALGASTLEASARDRRYRDPAWTGNPLLHRMLQSHLAAEQTAQRLLDIADLDERKDLRMRFLVDNLIDASAPSNVPLLNPSSFKEVVNTGGANLVKGALNLARDMVKAPRVPTMVDTDAFDVGENLAVSPGAVVLRTPVFELIQYAPTTGEVNQLPLLLVPPTINKYYVLDLAPGRSIVEHLVRNGQQVFIMSWRNPTARHADWNLDTYIESVIEAFDATRAIAGVDQALMFGACSGGIIASMAAAHLAATGRHDDLAALTLAVTVIDQAGAGLTQAMVDRGRADAAAARSARVGYLDGRSLAEVFAWLRPNDLVWNYWVNNYLLGKKPPAFDILYWNADTTRMSAGLHRDFLDLGLENALVHPGQAKALGVPVDLSLVTADAYVIGGVADHITPWQNCYQSTQLLGGKSRFVLSTSGHIAALVNPPTNAKASFQTSADNPADPQAWQDAATMHAGTWWTDWVTWLAERSGSARPAPTALGRGRFEPTDAAPGTYVHDT